MTQKAINIAAGLLLSISSYAQDTQTRPFHIGLIYPLSTNGINAAEYTNYCSIHAIAGLSGGERGFCAAGFANVVNGSADGFIAGGFTNIIKESADGAQVAGFVNCIGGSADGLQAAGFLNFAGNGQAAQVAGFANITAGNMEGFQGAGFLNIAANTDVQVAGFMNIARSADGLQAAGFLNTAGDAHTQIAGFINVAKKVKGAQIGFINIAEENDNPIGIINIVKNGEKNLGITIDESLTTMATFRSGGRNIYGILGAGYNLRSSRLLWALETGLGMHAPITKGFRMNFEVAASSLTDFHQDAYFKSTFRVLPALMLGEKWEIFAGPTFNFTEYSIYNESLDTRFVWSNTSWDSFYGFNFGAVGGIQVHL